MALHITYQKASVTVVEIAITTHANFRHQVCNFWESEQYHRWYENINCNLLFFGVWNKDRASVKHYSNAVHYEALYHDLYCAGGYVTEETPGTAW